ncbi:MAG: division/cell wall cluster transcriptional repressor MraZ [Anaerolineaceae bacterium]
MFFGQFEHNIDAKGRLTIPFTFREQTPGGIFVTKGFDANLIAYSKQDYAQIANNLSSLSITDAESRSLRRMIFGNTAELGFDTAGRILIPAYLRDMAKITNAVVLVGIGDSFEIWSVNSWSEQDTKINDSETNSNRWAAFDISTRGK